MTTKTPVAKPSTETADRIRPALGWRVAAGYLLALAGGAGFAGIVVGVAAA